MGHEDLLAYTGGEFDTGSVRVEQFEVTDRDAQFNALRAVFSSIEQGRYVPPGTYHRLVVDGRMWMSDTPVEKRDHRPAVDAMRRGGRVIINGLGLGLITAAALRLGCHVDVVELDQRVIDAVSPWLVDVAAERGGVLVVHQGDAYGYQWPAGARWDVAWHDIWPSISVDNLKGMHRLHRRYGRRVSWQGSWCRQRCEDARRLM